MIGHVHDLLDFGHGVLDGDGDALAERDLRQPAALAASRHADVGSPALEGKLMVNFTIGGTGMVKSTEVKSSTLPDPRLDDCILRRLATWKFPNPRGGIDVAVTYPFIFKTLGR